MFKHNYLLIKMAHLLNKLPEELIKIEDEDEDSLKLFTLNKFVKDIEMIKSHIINIDERLKNISSKLYWINRKIENR